MSRKLVVFGAGYVGESVVRLALREHWSVIALTRNRDRASALERLGAHVVIADLADAGWHARMGATPDYVVNCVSSGGGGLPGYRHSYLEGGQSIVAWMRTCHFAGTSVYTSSTSVYPQGDGVTVDEESDVGGGETAGVLLEAETVMRSAPGRSFVLRLAGIYGPGRHHLLVQLRAGETVFSGHGHHRLNLIHRDDAASAIMAVLRSPESVPGQIFNVADDGPAPKSEVIAWLCDRLGLPPPVFTGAPSPGRGRIVPDRIVSAAKIRHVLGWSPAHPAYREGYASILGLSVG